MSVSAAPTPRSVTWEQVALDVKRVRAQTVALCAPLAIEDHVVQSMPDVSPPKWHLAHTTWFFETFILRPYAGSYRVFDATYEYLFNSYYQSLGAPFPRAERGLLSRPTVDDVHQYRSHVDAALLALLADCPPAQRDVVRARVVLGLHHEQQHQELLITDIKHILSRNIVGPVYQSVENVAGPVSTLGWTRYPGGVYEIGFAGDGFCFDNETPRHRAFVSDFALATRLVTNGEYLEFMAAGGYTEPSLWLSDGWSEARKEQWQAPLYWERRDDGWWNYTLSGWRKVEQSEPVCHVSYYEADAYARWAGKRLPTEAEWEIVAVTQPVDGNFVESGRYHPRPATGDGVRQIYGDVWEWTQSDYSSYPGYKPLAGALGEYNGKFMANQRVLRGGSCASPKSHLRSSYRNFFYPHSRWQFSGIRLADGP